MRLSLLSIRKLKNAPFMLHKSFMKQPLQPELRKTSFNGLKLRQLKIRRRWFKTERLHRFLQRAVQEWSMPHSSRATRQWALVPAMVQSSLIIRHTLTVRLKTCFCPSVSTTGWFAQPKIRLSSKHLFTRIGWRRWKKRAHTCFLKKTTKSWLISSSMTGTA